MTDNPSARPQGGPVPAYVVGEREGGELFIPGAGGIIVPNEPTP